MKTIYVYTINGGRIGIQCAHAEIKGDWLTCVEYDGHECARFNITKIAGYWGVAKKPTEVARGLGG